MIPAWYQVERENFISEFRDVKKAAITADGWTSLAQDHYITVTVHYTKQGKILGKVLRTKAVYEAQTGAVVAEEIEEILQEFGISDNCGGAWCISRKGELWRGLGRAAPGESDWHTWVPLR
ncbi:hypothetical protein N1851_005234 [Merluccius polli]|uniref:Uncharacterized protein n=1 Tax=Merluccius polli TaxID=89951 RepID=A0AA47N754_MERPO|nr:hypothetical protein N1851_005234 [Merluccius polli]